MFAPEKIIEKMFAGITEIKMKKGEKIKDKKEEFKKQLIDELSGGLMHDDAAAPHRAWERMVAINLCYNRLEGNIEKILNYFLQEASFEGITQAESDLVKAVRDKFLDHISKHSAPKELILDLIRSGKSHGIYKDSKGSHTAVYRANTKDIDEAKKTAVSMIYSVLEPTPDEKQYDSLDLCIGEDNRIHIEIKDQDYLGVSTELLRDENGDLPIIMSAPYENKTDTVGIDPKIASIENGIEISPLNEITYPQYINWFFGFFIPMTTANKIKKVGSAFFAYGYNGDNRD